ncbi:MAG: hypothetical protein CM15mP63_4770 [Gammaproteobacteria bacterium]|nr:MAG: hypothetical protein CM15mP63_4770 [Gammaproteobacteria bacterium]
MLYTTPSKPPPYINSTPPFHFLYYLIIITLNIKSFFYFSFPSKNFLLLSTYINNISSYLFSPLIFIFLNLIINNLIHLNPKLFLLSLYYLILIHHYRYILHSLINLWCTSWISLSLILSAKHT